MEVLRSPRLAVWLLVYLTAYAAAVTLIPQEGAVLPADIASWQAERPGVGALTAALGLHRAFWSIAFIVPAFLLTLSTAVCSWRRTRTARALAQLGRSIPETLRARASGRPHATVTAGTDADALELVSRTAADLGLRVTRDDGVLRASRTLWAAWGSPVFHWALVGLFVSVGVGQAIKWEGVIGIPVGHSITDVRLSYGSLVKGPLAPAEPSSGYTIAVSDMPLDFVAGDVERGHAPLVTLSRDDEVVAEGRVFPNSPLSHGALTIHRDIWGLAVVAALETSAGAELGRRNFLIDLGSTGGTGRLGIEDGMPPETGVSAIRFDIPLDPAPDGFTGDIPRDPRTEVSVPGAADIASATLRPGETVTFPGGELSLKVVDVTRYVRLLVVHDPSVPVVYAFLVLASVGCAVALLVHPRAIVAVERRRDDGTVVADVIIVGSRLDTLFSARAREALARVSVPEGES